MRGDRVRVSRAVTVRCVQLRIPDRFESEALHKTRADTRHLRGSVDEPKNPLRQRQGTVVEPILLKVVRVQPNLYVNLQTPLPDDPGDTREARLVNVNRREPPTER